MAEMDFYDKVDYLCEQMAISRRELARLAGIPQSSLSTAFWRRSEQFAQENKAKIYSTLRKKRYIIACGDDEQQVEINLIYDRMNAAGREALFERAKSLEKDPGFMKS